MADEKLLHAEDVIFNKPSLKEFVRLIKNGTINAIWPSTKAEFNWWNEEGRFNYSHIRNVDDLRIKSQKTSMTVYYGDHQDSAATQILNTAETQNKFNILKENIESEQQKIIDEYFFDTKQELKYPNLGLDTDTGELINGTEIIQNGNYVDTTYDQNIQYIEDLISIIKDFSPSWGSQRLFLSIDNLDTQYLTFFTNYVDQVNRIIDGLSDFTYDIDTIKNSDNKAIKENEVFNFQVIKDIVEQYQNIITNFENKIKDYEIINTRDFTYAAKDVKDLANIYINLQKELPEDIRNFVQKVNSGHKELFPLITKYTIPNCNITNNNITNKELIETYIDPYQIMHKNLLTLAQKGLIDDGSNITISKNKYDEVCEKITNIIAETEEDKENALNQKKNIINEYYTIINDLINTIQNYDTDIKYNIQNYINNSIPSIIYSYNPPSINNGIMITKELQQFFNIIEAEFSIANIGNIDINSLSYSNFENDYNMPYNNIIDLIIGALNSLNEDQSNVINLLETFLNHYGNLISIFKNYTVLPVNHESQIQIDEINKNISNKEELLTSVQVQHNELTNYLDAIKIISPGTQLAEIYNNLSRDYSNLTHNINTVTVNSEEIGSQTDFENWVNENFNKNKIALTIKHLLKTIYSNPNEDINTSNFIPEPSGNYLDINNKSSLLQNYKDLTNEYYESGRKTNLIKILNLIKTKINTWSPIYNSDAINHYTCINVGSFIQFTDESSTSPYDGSISIEIDEEMHYPLVNGLANTISSSTTRDSQIPTIAGLKSIFGENFDQISNKTVGSTYKPLYLNAGTFTIASNIVSGTYQTLKDNNAIGWRITDTSGNGASIQAVKVFGAVYNDYAEYRSAEAHPGRCIIENGDGTLSLSTSRLQLGANIVSDTYGFAIGETNEATCPVAVCGRVLVYPLESKELFTPGAAVCSGPEGTVSLMTREEIREWPDAIIGYVSEVPTYDTWGSDNVPVNGRIWIKIK